MDEMPDSLQDQGKTLDEPCTGCPLDETGVHQSSSSEQDPSTSRQSQGEETNTDTKKKDVPPPPKSEQIPASDRLTIYFHAVLSKDFKFKLGNDRIFLRVGGRFGNLDANAAELTVSWDLEEHGFFVEGILMMNKKEAASVSIPYKYVVYKYKKAKYKSEYIYKLDSKETTMRCLFVKECLISEEGEWHQYDDIICAPSVLARMWSDQRKNIIEGRAIAGRIMLKTIFDLLSSWSDINLKSFLTQLNQFYQVYAHPFVYEETPKKWLEYGAEEVNFLLKQVVLESMTHKDIKDPLKTAVIALYIFSKYKIRPEREELSRLCMALCLPKLPKDDFASFWTDFTTSFSNIKNLPEIVRTLVDRVKTEGIPHWILALPLLHFLRGLSMPFEPVACTINPKYDLSWAGLWGLKHSDVNSHKARRAIINVIEPHKHLFEMDMLLARSLMRVMTVEELVECSSIAQNGLLDLLQAFYLQTPVDLTSSCT
ncbi:hypothetical protein SKAU_G00301810, partial [Synaphobranchus kaupii]